jgi:multiple sugar transport system substrate-binding protein
MASRRTVLGAGAGLSGILAGACGAPSGGTTSGQSAAPVTLEFFHEWDGVRTKLVEDMCADFQKLHPNITPKPTLSRGNLSMDKIFATLVSGTAPDIVNIRTETGLVWADKKTLRFLDDLLKRDRINVDQVLYKSNADLIKLGGKPFGLPQTTAGVDPILMYNRQVFSQNGLDPAKPPKTWQEMEPVAQKLTQREGDKLTKIGFVPTNRPFWEWLALNNGDMFSPDGRKATFGGAEGQDTLTWLADFTQRTFGSIKAVKDFYAANRTSAAIRGARLPWYDGKEAMFAEIVSMFFRIDEEEPGFPLGAAVPPYNGKNPKAKSKTIANYVWVYAIPQASKQHDAAWTFDKYISLEDGARKALLAQKRPAAVRKFNEEKAYRDLNPYWGDVVLKNLEASVAMPQSPAWDDITKSVNKAVDSVLDGKMGVKDALGQAVTESQNLLDAVR